MTELPPTRIPGALESIEQLVSTNVPTVESSATAGEVLALLSAKEFDSVDEIVVCRDGVVVGVATIGGILRSSPDVPISELADPDPPRVHPGLDPEQAAWKAVEHGEASLVVVDASGQFRGLVPPYRMLGVLLAEHDEDLARLGGYLRGTETARAATAEPVRRRLVHRVPWLLLGLVGALLAADIVGAFERELEDNLLLAFFVPGIVYLADAVGTQTETIVIRGLSAGVPIARVVVREIITGILIGLGLAVAFFPLAVIRWGDVDVAAAVAVALFAACSVANLVALALPWSLQKLDIDPAFGSGPLATVIQDLLSIVIYFSVAMTLVD